MGRNRPKKVPAKNKLYKRQRDFKNRIKDEDQIYDEFHKPIPQPLNPDLPGLGQFYCTSCARYFANQEVIEIHFRSSQHKRLLRRIKTEKPYTLEESNAAAGLGSYTFTPKGHKKGEEPIPNPVEPTEMTTEPVETTN